MKVVETRYEVREGVEEIDRYEVRIDVLEDGSEREMYVGHSRNSES